MRAHSSKKLAVFAISLAIGLAGCASGGGNGDRPAGATADRIVKAELEPLGQIDAYRAIERLRPGWLRSRGGLSGDQPVLYVNGSRTGNLSDLTSMRTSDIEQIEHMSGSDATTRYGTGHGGGVILVTTVR